VSFSRIYLCAHTPADVIAGHLLGMLFIVFWLFYDQQIDHSIVGARSWLPWVAPPASLLLLMAYPAPATLSPAFTETAMVVGCATGWMTGSSWLFLQFVRDPTLCLHSGPDCAWLMLARVILGLLVVAAAFVVALRASVALLPPMACFAPNPHHFTRLSLLKKASAGGLALRSLSPSHTQAHSYEQTNGHFHGQARNGVMDAGNGHTKKSSKGAGGVQKVWGAKSLIVLCTHTSRQWTSYGYERAVPVLFLSYSCVGFAASFAAPLLMRLAGL
jgi:hypothetical protein